MERLPELIVERGTATVREPIDQALLKRMLSSDLEIAQRMVGIANYHLVHDALKSALCKLSQLQALETAPGNHPRSKAHIEASIKTLKS